MCVRLLLFTVSRVNCRVAEHLKTGLPEFSASSLTAAASQIQASSGRSAAPSRLTFVILRERVEINKPALNLQFFWGQWAYEPCTFNSCLQFVVQLLFLIGQIGNITCQGPIGFFQLYGSKMVNALICWIRFMQTKCSHFPYFTFSMRVHQTSSLKSFQAFQILSLKSRECWLHTELMVMSFSASSWRWRAIISFSSSSFIIFSFSRSEYCSSAMERASCSESALVRVISSWAANESLREIWTNKKKWNFPIWACVTNNTGHGLFWRLLDYFWSKSVKSPLLLLLLQWLLRVFAELVSLFALFF